MGAPAPQLDVIVSEAGGVLEHVLRRFTLVARGKQPQFHEGPPFGFDEFDIITYQFKLILSLV